MLITRTVAVADDNCSVMLDFMFNINQCWVKSFLKRFEIKIKIVG